MTASTADLQREAESTRANLSSTLDQLRNSLTTAALASGALTIAKEGSATLAKAAVGSARAHPLAALLIGAGVVLLLSGEKEETVERRIADRVQKAAGNGVDKAKELVAEVKEKVSRNVDTDHRAEEPGALARLAHEQPILVAALGVALGAAVGAALPLGSKPKDGG